MYCTIKKRIVMKKKIFLFCILLFLIIIALNLFTETKSGYPFSLPSEYDLIDSPGSHNQLIYTDNKAIGGIISIRTPNAKIELINGTRDIYQTRSERTRILIELLHDAGIKEADISKYDYMRSSSLYSDCQITFSNSSEEYVHYIFFGNSVVYDLWFDKSQIDNESIQKILSKIEH